MRSPTYGEVSTDEVYKIIEIVGWVTACGYKCEIKPNSYTASGIANKLSK